MPGPLGDRLILRALRESNGDAHAVSEDAIRAGDAAALARDRRRRGTGGRLRARGDRASSCAPAAFRATPRCWCSTRAAARRTGSECSMRIAIFDPFSGIAGDMTLGALLQRRTRPGVAARAAGDARSRRTSRVEIREVIRGEIVCRKVDFDIPPQPHGRHIHADPSARREERRARDACASAPIARSRRSRRPKARSTACRPRRCISTRSAPSTRFSTSSASIWGLELLGVERVYCGTIALGDGTVTRRARRPAGARAGDAEAARGASGSPGPGGLRRARDADRRGARARALVRAAARGVRAACAAASARARRTFAVARTRCASSSPTSDGDGVDGARSPSSSSSSCATSTT